MARKSRSGDDDKLYASPDEETRYTATFRVVTWKLTKEEKAAIAALGHPEVNFDPEHPTRNERAWRGKIVVVKFWLKRARDQHLARVTAEFDQKMADLMKRFRETKE